MGKSALKSLSSYPPANPSFGTTPTIKYNKRSSRVQFYSRCHTQRIIDGAPPANPSLGMTMTKLMIPTAPDIHAVNYKIVDN